MINDWWADWLTAFLNWCQEPNLWVVAKRSPNKGFLSWKLRMTITYQIVLRGHSVRRIWVFRYLCKPCHPKGSGLVFQSVASWAYAKDKKTFSFKLWLSNLAYWYLLWNLYVISEMPSLTGHRICCKEFASCQDIIPPSRNPEKQKNENLVSGVNKAKLWWHQMGHSSDSQGECRPQCSRSNTPYLRGESQ